MHLLGQVHYIKIDKTHPYAEPFGEASSLLQDTVRMLWRNLQAFRSPRVSACSCLKLKQTPESPIPCFPDLFITKQSRASSFYLKKKKKKEKEILLLKSPDRKQFPGLKRTRVFIIVFGVKNLKAAFLKHSSKLPQQ